MPPLGKQRWMSLSPSPLSPWQLWPGLFPCIYIQTASSKSTKEGPCRLSLQTPTESKEQRCSRLQYTATLLLSSTGTTKPLKELMGPIRKQYCLIVFLLKNKGHYTELAKQTRAAGLKGVLPPAAAQPRLFVLCSLVPQCTLVGIS